MLTQATKRNVFGDDSDEVLCCFGHWLIQPFAYSTISIRPLPLVGLTTAKSQIDHRLQKLLFTE